ncbi:MAG: helix-turn-helix domain-containing protein [Planctomycetota bacterium]
MAGKFLSLEEAARHLGVTIDEINRFVDRKKLFPMRDGANVKFKLDDIERVAADLADEAPGDGSGLALDLDLSSPSLGAGSAVGSGLDDLVLGDPADVTESIFGDDAGSAPSRTIMQPKGDDIALGGEDFVIGDAGSGLASSDLEIDSIIEASSPSLAKGGAAPSGADSNVVGGSGTLSIDLGSGSIGGLSGPAAAALSGAIGESGLSLEGDLGASDMNLGGSGLDLGGSGVALGGSGVALGSGIGSGIDDVGGVLGGDAFELGDATTDDESASVVVATEDSGDSSFFGTVSDDSGSVSLEDASSAALIPGDDGFLQGVAGPPFSALQIVGLICCTLFLLTAALVMIDLVWSIRTPAGTPISSPLLKALTDLFSWR